MIDPACQTRSPERRKLSKISINNYYEDGDGPAKIPLPGHFIHIDHHFRDLYLHFFLEEILEKGYEMPFMP